MKQTIAQQINWDFETNGDLEIKDKNGNQIYYENSKGTIINSKPNQTMKTFKQYLQTLHACEESIIWAGDKTIEEAVHECHRGDWLLWLAQRCDVELKPLTLAKAHCANTVRHLMKDERSIKAVDVAIAFGQGRATLDELNEVYSDAAYAVASATADSAVKAAAYAAAAAAADADSDVADAAYAYAAAADAAAAAAAAAAYAAAAAAAEAANRQQTADICRKHIGELIIIKVNQLLNQPTNDTDNRTTTQLGLQDQRRS
jgi:hypothetical protein